MFGDTILVAVVFKFSKRSEKILFRSQSLFSTIRIYAVVHNLLNGPYCVMAIYLHIYFQS